MAIFNSYVAVYQRITIVGYSETMLSGCISCFMAKETTDLTHDCAQLPAIAVLLEDLEGRRDVPDDSDSASEPWVFWDFIKMLFIIWMWVKLVLTIHNFGVPNFDPYPFETTQRTRVHFLLNSGLNQF